MLGRAYCFVIFFLFMVVWEFLFMIAIVCVLCVGHLRMCASSCRACTGLDRHLTCWQSRSRVSGTEGCPSHISSGSSIRKVGYKNVQIMLCTKIVEPPVCVVWCVGRSGATGKWSQNLWLIAKT